MKLKNALVIHGIPGDKVIVIPWQFRPHLALFHFRQSVEYKLALHL